MNRNTAMFSLLLSGVLLVNPCVSAEPLSDRIRRQVEAIEAGRLFCIEGHALSSVIVLPALYEKYDYQPIWTNQQSVEQLLAEIRSIHRDGLTATDYHLKSIERLQAQIHSVPNPAAELVADYDLLLTDALVRLGYHLLIGKVDPESLDSNWNMDRILDLDTILDRSDAIVKGEVFSLIESFRPQAAYYRNLKATLHRYRDIEAAGGWPFVSDGDTLKPGMNGPRVAELRLRLVVTDMQPGLDSGSNVFDEVLESAVRAFQRRHGLDAEGEIDKGTLAALNVPVGARIDQIRVNLERGRWILHDLPEEFVVADIAGYEVRYIQDGQSVWKTRAQFGKDYRMTPVFRELMSYIEFNPAWTVPPTILRKDVLPAIRRDPDYLQKKDMIVIDRHGEEVDPDTVDWSRYTGRTFPYAIRQQPGEKNELGRVKFMFPNEHFIYIHDTPNKSLFERSERAFSSGCIRIESPFEFAELLLEDQPDWDQSRMDAVLESSETTLVDLTSPITIMLLYWTVTTTDDGEVAFRKDIYGRDQAVLRGLDGTARFRGRRFIE